MNRIKDLQTALPRGTPLDSGSLRRLGISSALAHEYIQTGWLARLGRGVFMFPGDRLERNATVRFLSERVPGLHVAGKSALEWHGFRQNLAHRETLCLRGSRNAVLPGWFLERFPARFSAARLFSDDLPPSFGLAPLPESRGGPLVSAPERALLEMLSEVGVQQEVEEARGIMETVRQLRTRELGTLLRACRMIKAVRLCVIWAEELGLPWAGLASEAVADRLETSRWIKLMKDGRTLILKPR
ncbi:MAG: type IV toxin-antitoxin system AbiEi family antitoxin domain-containing protein [Verrucomicrobia bacterium]|nr:type IV toxin-antitoxin system AbiEi family antitoxin domain-containing protein [Verrucomicrobiota bacterium]